tara:strand:- start:7325 stop:7687 length:363 start_codon:yes stop_codon:yes gene_type:complete
MNIYTNKQRPNKRNKGKVRNMKSINAVIKNVKTQIDSDLNFYVADLTKNLRKFTPIDTGAAKSRWAKLGGTVGIENKVPVKIITNRVGYAGILDGAEGRPTSKQAPRGIVEPALKHTNQR